MADIPKPSSTSSNSSTGADPVDKTQKAKPEKPDEQLFKESLAKAEKEHAAAMEKFVCLTVILNEILS